MKYTSWLMKMSVPSNWSSAQISASMLDMSRCVVGSSISSRFGGSSSSFTSASRLFSPPLSTRDRLEHVVAAEQEGAEHGADELLGQRAAACRAPPRARCARGSASRRGTGSSSRPSTWWPSSRVPDWTGRTPARIFSSVDLPAPFGPTSTMRWPRSASKFMPR